MPAYQPDDVYANFSIKIPDVHCLENKDLIEAVFQMKRNKERHKVILFDEVGQELKARESFNKVQTEYVSFSWQMPKRDIIQLYCSNPGNSADIILRLATCQTIVPAYHKGPTYEECKARGEPCKEDYITAGIIYNYELWVAEWTIWNFWWVQMLFDSLEPIE
jgi:branched-subunit amino acid aminotransferase/4-amino-4-deoxychorismate lyase